MWQEVGKFAHNLGPWVDFPPAEQMDMALADYPYRIELSKLKSGTHTFRFELVTEKLLPLGMRSAPGEEAADASPLPPLSEAWAEVLLVRSDRLVDVTLTYDGTVQLACDRCLLPYPLPLSGQTRVVYSHDTSVEAVADESDVHYLSASAPYLDLRQELYECLLLLLPLRQIPPDCPGSRCPAGVWDLLKAGEAATEGTADPDDDAASSDPRWAALRGLQENE